MARYMARTGLARSIAALLLVFLVLAGTAPLQALAASVAQPLADTATVTATAGTNTTTTNTTTTTSVKMLLSLYIGSIRAALAGAGLLNATPAQVAAALGINTTAAEELLRIANMTPAEIANMTLEEAQKLLNEAKYLYHVLVEAAARIAEQNRVTVRIMARIEARVAEKLANLSKVLAERFNDTELLNLTEKLMQAIREGNLTAVKRLEEAILAHIEANAAYVNAIALDHALASMLASLATKGNATSAEAARLLHKLLKDVEEAQKLLERLQLRLTRAAAVAPTALLRLAAAMSVASDVNTTASVVNATMKLSPVAAAAAAAQAWAAKLEARIEADIATANATMNVSREVAEKALKLLQEARRLVGEASNLTLEGRVSDALKLLAKAQSMVVEAEMLLDHVAITEALKELRLRHVMPALPPRLNLPHLPLPVVNVSGKAEAVLAAAANASIARAVEAIMKANMTIAVALNVTASANLSAAAMARIKALIEEAKDSLAEAVKLLEEARAAYRAGNYTEAIAKANMAAAAALRAEALARAAMGGVTALVGVKAGFEEARKLIERAQMHVRELVKEMEKQMEKLMEHLHGVFNMTKNVTSIIGKVFGKIKHKAGKAANMTANMTRENVEKMVAALEKRLAQLEERIEALNATLAAAAAANVSVKAGMNVTALEKLLARVEAEVREAAAMLAQGNVTGAAELAAKARADITALEKALNEAARQLQGLRGELEKAVKHAAERLARLEEEFERLLEAVRALNQSLTIANMTENMTGNVTTGFNATLVVLASAKLSEAKKLLQEAEALLPNVTAGNATAARLFAEIVARIHMLLAEVRKEMAMAAGHLVLSAETTAEKLMERLEEALRKAQNITTAVQVMTSTGLVNASTGAKLATEADAALKALQEALAELKAVLATKANASAAVNVTAELQAAVEKAQEALRSFEALKRDTIRAVMDARARLLREIAVLEQNITALQAEIAALKPLAAANATLAAKLDQASSLLTDAEQQLAEAKALLAWSGETSGHGKASGKSKGGGGETSAEIVMKVTLLVQAKGYVDKAAADVSQAAQLVAEVKAAVGASSSSSGGGGGTKTPPMPKP